ncbi:hypothetical protein CB1_000968006 [Camelus ferus]|nr:hypothetical protein CB1_000968006 [Camelus ferus]
MFLRSTDQASQEVCGDAMGNAFIWVSLIKSDFGANGKVVSFNMGRLERAAMATISPLWTHGQTWKAFWIILVLLLICCQNAQLSSSRSDSALENDTRCHHLVSTPPMFRVDSRNSVQSDFTDNDGIDVMQIRTHLELCTKVIKFQPISFVAAEAELENTALVTKIFNFPFDWLILPNHKRSPAQ